ncbi:sensor histidine kinase [Paenibacillus oceani]|uniref:Histidine kinase n=1 Tax=Paenibacillus oceani TaxID=2772510 RepID=A0A927CBY6_9BACL|nr:ATP-binding protein [Paenibacillus oceani]MBD2863767.1 histidine kinase [Paenibacillus oceani]
MLHSIKWKTFIAIIAFFAVATTVAGVASYNIIESDLQEQAIHNANLEINFAIKQMDDQFKYLDQAYYTVSFDKEITKELSKEPHEVNYKMILTKLESMLFSSNYKVHSIYFKDIRSGVIVSTDDSSIVKHNSNYWVEGFTAEELKNPGLIHTRDLATGSASLVALAGQVRKNYFDNPVALLSVNMLQYSFKEILVKDNVYPNSLQIISNEHNEVIANSANADPSAIMPIIKSVPTGERLFIDGQSYIVISGESDKYGWNYSKLLPEKEVFAGIYKVRSVLLFIVFVFSLVMLVFLYRVLDHVTAPIYQLSAMIKRYRQINYEKNNEKVEFVTNRKDEFSFLFQSLNDMVRRIDRLIDEVYKASLYKKETQLRIYRNSIDPHFIYNILDSIIWTMKFKEYDKAVDIIQNFSSFLHHTLHANREFICVMDMWAELISYCKLESFLKDDLITYTIEFEEAVQQQLVPSFILQPLVENCFKHGFKGRKQGEIKVTGYQEGQDFVCMVEDNGNGMTEENLDALMNKIRNYDINANKKHFGIASVHNRLQLYYGENYGLTIMSEPGKGTRVMINMPIRRGMTNGFENNA